MQPINMITIYYWDKKIKKRLHVLEADIITIKKNSNLMSLAQMMHFLQDVFKMNVIALTSVINHYHINGWHLFWVTLYKEKTFRLINPTKRELGRINKNVFVLTCSILCKWQHVNWWKNTKATNDKFNGIAAKEKCVLIWLDFINLFTS